ncbi:hypothetical protein [Neolewinella persica]|uniref:hypothetical protein n=1 Tax=Neolewinella persica TaxID=70998 RepID=UPI00038054F6|nr:hypothetical protein [Neolewinella persica]
MRLFSFTVLVITLVGCESKNSLTGHWHYHPVDKGHSYVQNVDFISDTTFTYNDQSPRWEGHLGSLDQKGQTMYWGGECIMGDWMYRIISRNKIEVFDRREKVLLGVLTRKPSCSPPDDLFLESRFAIELPVFKDGLPDIGPLALVHDITVGPLKEEFSSVYPGGIQVALGDIIVNPENTSRFFLFDLQREVKVREADRPKLRVLVYLDQNTPLEVLEPVLKHYAGRKEHLYFAGITSSATGAQMSYRKENVCELLEKLIGDKR